MIRKRFLLLVEEREPPADNIIQPASSKPLNSPGNGSQICVTCTDLNDNGGNGAQKGSPVCERDITTCARLPDDGWKLGQRLRRWASFHPSSGAHLWAFSCKRHIVRTGNTWIVWSPILGLAGLLAQHNGAASRWFGCCMTLVVALPCISPPQRLMQMGQPACPPQK